MASGRPDFLKATPTRDAMTAMGTEPRTGLARRAPEPASRSSRGPASSRERSWAATPQQPGWLSRARRRKEDGHPCRRGEYRHDPAVCATPSRPQSCMHAWATPAFRSRGPRYQSCATERLPSCHVTGHLRHPRARCSTQRPELRYMSWSPSPPLRTSLEPAWPAALALGAVWRREAVDHAIR